MRLGTEFGIVLLQLSASADLCSCKLALNCHKISAGTAISRTDCAISFRLARVEIK